MRVQGETTKRGFKKLSVNMNSLYEDGDAFEPDREVGARQLGYGDPILTTSVLLLPPSSRRVLRERRAPRRRRRAAAARRRRRRRVRRRGDGVRAGERDFVSLGFHTLHPTHRQLSRASVSVLHWLARSAGWKSSRRCST